VDEKALFAEAVPELALVHAYNFSFGLEKKRNCKQLGSGDAKKVG